jgi:hypothetical protein
VVLCDRPKDKVIVLHIYDETGEAPLQPTPPPPVHTILVQVHNLGACSGLRVGSCTEGQ